MILARLRGRKVPKGTASFNNQKFLQLPEGREARRAAVEVEAHGEAEARDVDELHAPVCVEARARLRVVARVEDELEDDQDQRGSSDEENDEVVSINNSSDGEEEEAEEIRHGFGYGGGAYSRNDRLQLGDDLEGEGDEDGFATEDEEEGMFRVALCYVSSAVGSALVVADVGRRLGE